MEFNINIPNKKVELQLDYIIRFLERLEKHMSVEFDAVKAAVAETVDVEKGAVDLLGKLHDMLVAAGTDPVALQELANTLNAEKEALAAAIVANTPSA
jgi:hypothetical protein